MRLRKLLLGAGVITSALAISAGFGIRNASAETGSDTTTEAKETAILPASIGISYKDQNITVKENSEDKKDTKLYLGIGTYSAKATTDVRVKKWIEYDYSEEKGLTIDTSSLAVTKTQYVVLKGDVNTKEVAIQLAATPSRLAASIDYTDPTAPALVLNDITKGKANAVAITNVEFATTNGSSFKVYEAATTTGEGVNKVTKAGTDLTIYQKLGATLKVRQAATKDIAGIDTSEDADNNNSSTVSIKVNGEDVTAYAPKGTFASKELKVKVAKLAAGPKIAINYAKNTVSLPRTAEYRTAVNSGFTTELVRDATKKTVVVPITDFHVTSAFTLDVRTAAKANTTDITKSKSASNITEVAIPEITTIKSMVAGDKSNDESKEIDASNFATADLASVTSNGKVTFAYGTKSGQATVKNADTENAYEIYVTTEANVGFIKNNENETYNYVAPVSTVAGAKKVAAGNKITLKNLKDGDKIFIRVAGNAKKKTFASAYSAFGTVKIPVAATATPAPTESASASTGD